MDIEKLLTDAVIVEAETPLSKVISAMESAGKHEAVVIKNNEFSGIVCAKDILKKQTGNPDKVRIETLARKVSIGDKNRSIEELAGMMLTGDYSEMPFHSNDGIKTLAKTTIIKFLNKNLLANKTAKDIMSVPYFVSHDDNIKSIEHMLLNLNVSKIPVVDDDNKTVGIVDGLNLLTTITKRKKAHAGELDGEKKSIGGVEVSSFMDKEILAVTENESLDSVAKKMADNNASCILVERDGLLTGIITPKDILKLVGKPNEGFYMNLSGYMAEDEIEAEHIKEIAKKTLEKLGKLVDMTYAVMHIEKHDKGAVKSLFTVSARLGTNLGLFTADYTDWDLSLCVKKAMDKILMGVEKDKGKRRTLRRTKG